MATRKTTTTKTSTTRKRTQKNIIDDPVFSPAPVNEEKEEKVQTSLVEEEKPAPKKPKKFADDDLIPCVSISYGEVLYEGEKSKCLYDWIGFGDVVEMEYRDLISAVRMRRACVTKPRVVVQNNDFVKQNPELEKLYSTLYSLNDLKNIFSLPVAKMKAVLKDLPAGAQDSIKTIASAAIDDGVLDSVQKIKAIDEVFGTQLSIKIS